MSIPRCSSSNEKSGRHVVLLVEDERFVREATCRIMQSAGLEVLPAADAQEAVQLYEENRSRIDLLMTDLVLPNGNGRRLGDHIRHESSGVSILLTSGYLCAEDQESPDDCTYYLAKPYSKSDLLEKIAKIFRTPLRPAARVS